MTSLVLTMAVSTWWSTPSTPAAGWDPWRSLCHLEDDAEDGLSDCQTVFACPDYDGDGSHFDDDADIDIAGESGY